MPLSIFNTKKKDEEKNDKKKETDKKTREREKKKRAYHNDDFISYLWKCSIQSSTDLDQDVELYKETACMRLG